MMEEGKRKGGGYVEEERMVIAFTATGHLREKLAFGLVLQLMTQPSISST